jgi:hypothetical protein
MRKWRKYSLSKGYSPSQDSMQEVIPSKFGIRMGDVFQIFYEVKTLIGKIKRGFVIIIGSVGYPYQKQ